MRAFMSTSDSHLRLPYPSEGLARHYATQAAIEARAILVMTEGNGFYAVYPPFLNRDTIAGARALAEALTAFVAEGE